MPLAPPVMSATFPASLMCLSSILTGYSRPRETRRAGPTLRAPPSIAESPHRVHCGSPRAAWRENGSVHPGSRQRSDHGDVRARSRGVSGRLDLEAGRRTPENRRTPGACADARRLRRAPSPRTPGHHRGHARSGDRAAPVLRGSRARRPRRHELRGMVICKAAELARDRIGRLVFVDALALMPGERVGDIVKRVSANETTTITTGPTHAEVEKRLFADLDPDLRAWALARYTPHPVAALEAPVELGGFWSQAWPTTVIRCRRATNPPETHQRRTAERLKATWHELDTGHYPMLSQPEELTRLLLGPVS